MHATASASYRGFDPEPHNVCKLLQPITVDETVNRAKRLSSQDLWATKMKIPGAPATAWPTVKRVWKFFNLVLFEIALAP